MKTPGLIIEDISYEHHGESYEGTYQIIEEYQPTLSFPGIFNLSEAKQESVPLEIFSGKLSGLQALSLHLSLKGWSNVRIASVLNRDPRTIWTTISIARQILSPEEKISLRESSSEVRLPLTIFADRRLGILESSVWFLRQAGWKNSSVAESLNLDPRTTSTCARRAREKLGGGSE